MKLPVHVEPVDHDHGHWCISCQLDTGIRLVWAISIGDTTGLRTTMWCTECASTNIHTDPQPRRCTGRP